jgi:hypothetical protein
MGHPDERQQVVLDLARGILPRPTLAKTA